MKFYEETAKLTNKKFIKAFAIKIKLLLILREKKTTILIIFVFIKYEKLSPLMVEEKWLENIYFSNSRRIFRLLLNCTFYFTLFFFSRLTKQAFEISHASMFSYHNFLLDFNKKRHFNFKQKQALVSIDLCYYYSLQSSYFHDDMNQKIYLYLRVKFVSTLV